ncbi:hypothetical protein L1987_10632 [Smallanthus sonchifolius]|uniref:Uncharacterized protein n=1 Tax=Smallanthus sonchifolius TaxID=185202 RepID=A0ACB9JSL9_9ASTR|nr:hypothetical protein L1987_10632 [Smallanthus sonchifolius]
MVLGATPAVLQEVTVRGASKPTREAPKSGNVSDKGFDFSRAVNGRGGISHTGQTKLDPRERSRNVGLAPNLAATSGPRSSTPGASASVPIQPLIATNQVVTQNRFSILDLPNSLKLNKLVETNEDLNSYDMELDGGERSNVPSNVRKENVICQTNRKYVEGVRVLPPSFLSPSKPVHDSVNAATIVIDQGEHEFFEDQVKALGLDYDYCIEDVESDDENGTAQFFAAQMKVGMPKVPLSTPTHSSK